MKYQRYKYTENNIAVLVETAIKEGLPCVQVYQEGKWPFSINVLNGFLVGRQVAKTERLQMAIAEYKKSYSRYSRYCKLSDADIHQVITLRAEGKTLSNISQKTGLNLGFVAYILSGKMVHPSAPKEKIIKGKPI